MKDILIAAKNLKIGGIEKSLINLINYLKYNGYNITLLEDDLNQLRSTLEMVKDFRNIRRLIY